MKTAEEYYDLFEEYDTKLLYLDAFKKVINEARKEAIEECAKRASVMYKTSQVTGRDYPQVNEESILSLIKELT